MKLRKALALGLAAVLTLSVVGCGGSESTESSDNTEAKTETTETKEETTDTADTAAPEGVPSYSQITVGTDYTDLTASIKWIHHKTDREEDGTIAAMIAEFNKVYPNITVETEGVTDYAEDALLRLSTGDWGDIMFIPAVDKADLSTYFYPIDSL